MLHSFHLMNSKEDEDGNWSSVYAYATHSDSEQCRSVSESEKSNENEWMPPGQFQWSRSGSGALSYRIPLGAWLLSIFKLESRLSSRKNNYLDIFLAWAKEVQHVPTGCRLGGAVVPIHPHAARLSWWQFRILLLLLCRHCTTGVSKKSNQRWGGNNRRDYDDDANAKCIDLVCIFVLYIFIRVAHFICTTTYRMFNSFGNAIRPLFTQPSQLLRCKRRC